MDILELVHEDRSSSTRPFVCALLDCGKDFARRSDLVRHSRIHSNDRPWKCSFQGCKRDFIQRSALTVHFRVHTGERPHACEWTGCEKTFSDSSSLARHRRIHTGTRPYKCSVKSCQKTFCRKTTLTKHVRRQHPGSPTASQFGEAKPSIRLDGALLPPLPLTPRRSGRARRAKHSPQPSDFDSEEEEEAEEDDEDEYPMKGEEEEKQHLYPGAHYDNPQLLATPVQGEVAYFPLPPQSQSDSGIITYSYHSQVEASPHDVALQRSLSAPQAPYGYSLEQHMRRRESGEAAYMTPPPRERYLPEATWERHHQQQQHQHYDEDECHPSPQQLGTPVVYGSPRNLPPQTRIAPAQRRMNPHTPRTTYHPRSKQQRDYPDHVYQSAPAAYGVHHQAAYPELAYEPIPPTPAPGEFVVPPHDAHHHERMFIHASPHAPSPASFDGSPEPQRSLHSSSHFTSPYASPLPRRASSAAPDYIPPTSAEHLLPAAHTGLGISVAAEHQHQRQYSETDYPFLAKDGYAEDESRPAPATHYAMIEQHRRLSAAVGGSGMGDRFGQIAAGLPVPAVGLGSRPSFSTLISDFSGTVEAY